jgi:hypothetical protein
VDDRLLLIAVAILVLQVGKVAELTLETPGLEAVGRDNDQVDVMLLEDVLQLAATAIVVLLLLDLAWAPLLWLTVEALAWLELPWRQQVEKFFRIDELTELVDDGDHGLEVLVVERVQDRAHDAGALSLLD